MRNFSFWIVWAQVMGIILALFGISMCLIALSGYDLAYINNAFRQTIPNMNQVKDFQQWIYGVYGAVAVPFGILMFSLARYGLRNREKWAWNCLMISICSWVIIDTYFSVSFKVYANSVNNIILFVLLCLPLLMVRKQINGR